MSIVLRNLAKVELPDRHKLDVLKLYTHENYGGDVVCNYIYKADSNVVYLPLNKTKLNLVAQLLGEDIIDQRSAGLELSEPFVLNPAFKFRDHQSDPAHALLACVLQDQYALLEAGCGTGKTVVNTWVAGQLQCRILVLVDQSTLADQWKEAFEIVYNREAQVLDSSNAADFGDVVIATFQYLHKNPEVVKRLYSTFGVLLLDEFHSNGAVTYRNILYRLSNKYRIGTTATLMRKGYSHEVLTDLVSDVSVTMVDNNALIPDVHFLDTEVELTSNNPDDYTSILSDLASNAKRNEFILNLLRQLVEQNRSVLFVGARTESLKYLHREASKFCKAALFVGTTTLKQDKALKAGIEDGSIQVVFSEKKFEKGVDAPRLDAVVLAKLMNNEAAVTQIAGRVLRECEGKPTPLILDLVDRGSLSERFARNRMKWYKQKGYTIITTPAKLKLDKSSFRY